MQSIKIWRFIILPANYMTSPHNPLVFPHPASGVTRCAIIHITFFFLPTHGRPNKANTTESDALCGKWNLTNIPRHNKEWGGTCASHLHSSGFRNHPLLHPQYMNRSVDRTELRIRQKDLLPIGSAYKFFPVNMP